MQFNFTAPLISSAEDNESLTTKKTVTFRSTSDFDLASTGDFWNCNHCPNDDNYCQPYITGDKIYFQLKYVTYIDPNGYLVPDIKYYIVVGGIPLEVSSGSNGITVQKGTGVEDSINYINVIIDTSNLYFNNKECWYFQISVPTCGIQLNGLGEVLSPAAVKDCYDERILAGETSQQAIDNCVYLLCSDKYNTEFYCKVRCEEDTLLIEGDYSSGLMDKVDYDCEGRYYGYIDDGFNFSQSIYKPIFRIRGVIEPNGFEFEETLASNGKIKTKSKQRENFTLFSQKIPYYVVRQLSTCWNSGKLTIDGVVYKGANKLNKNFDEGLMWILKENLYIECDEINFTCG